jgi:hypothetical protein
MVNSKVTYPPKKNSKKIPGTWDNPFGLTWLTLSGVTAALQFSTGTLSSFTIQGGMQLTFGMATGNSVSVTLNAPDYKDWSVSLLVFIPDVSTLLENVVG